MTVLTQLGSRTSAAELYPDERLATLLGSIGYDLVRIAAVVCAAGLVWRFARMRRDERGPIAWFAAGALVTVLLILPMNFITDPVLHELVRIVAVASLPIGAVVAIVRHRAYGIDVVINRTLVYGALSTVLVGVYLASATAIEALSARSPTLPAVSGAGATALVLTPARERFQRLVNRMMYGQRDDAHLVVAAIGDRLEAIAGGGDALTAVVEQIARALRLPFVALETVDGVNGPRTIATAGAVDGTVERRHCMPTARSLGISRQARGEAKPR